MGKNKGIINEEGRTCTKCGEFKVWEEFNRSVGGINDRYTKCRACTCKRPIQTITEEGRTCTVCGQFKIWNEFYKHIKGLYGYRGQCKVCTNKQQQEHKENNLERELERQRIYRENNRDVLRERATKYREENRDRVDELSRQYYEDNKDFLLEKQKKYYETNREDRLTYKNKYDNSLSIYESYKDKLTILESPRETEDGYLEVKCATCREYFIPVNKQVSNRIRALSNTTSGENRLYCSDACKEACSVFGRHKYPKGFKRPNNREFEKEFRTMILERDNYTCQICNKQFDKKDLQAHHITPVVCSPMEQVDIENGICVCKECHINLHLTQEGITYSELAKVGKNTNEDNNNKDNED